MPFMPLLLALVAFRCLKDLTRTTDSHQHVAELRGRQRLRSASSADLLLPQARI